MAFADSGSARNDLTATQESIAIPHASSRASRMTSTACEEKSGPVQPPSDGPPTVRAGRDRPPPRPARDGPHHHAPAKNRTDKG